MADDKLEPYQQKLLDYYDAHLADATLARPVAPIVAGPIVAAPAPVAGTTVWAVMLEARIGRLKVTTMLPVSENPVLPLAGVVELSRH